MRELKEILLNDDEAIFNDRCYLDFKFFCERVLDLQIANFHMEWFNLVRNNRFVVIKASRGHGKTTILGVAYSIWLCWFKPGTHVLFTAAKLEQSMKQLDEVRDTIENNEYLKDLVPKDPSTTWKKTELKMSNGSRIFARAYTKGIKGIHVNYVFADEIQDCVDREIYNKSVAPTVNLKKGHICATGAPDNPADLLEELFTRPGYVGRSYPVITAPGKPLWPERFTLQDIADIRKRDGEASFQTQYMMNANAEVEGSVFPPDWITSCFDSTEQFMEKPKFPDSTIVLGADFAISKGKRADYDVYLILEKIGGKSIIRWAERHKGMSKDGKVQRLIDLYERYKPRRMVLDPSGIGEGVMTDLRSRGYPVEPAEFHSRARNKLLINLVTMIQPNRDGETSLIIPRQQDDAVTMTFTSKLVEELLAFREIKSNKTGMIALLSKGPHDDTVMALAMACKAASEQREFLDMVAI